MPALPPVQPSPQRRARRFPKLQVALLLLALAGVAAWGIITRMTAVAALKQRTEQDLVATVQIYDAAAGGTEEDVVLPGSVQPQTEAPIYARTNGYVRKWYTDIGTPVKKGQLLAELETPEVDQQLRQAAADFATARANDALARSSAQRWQALLATDSVSRQDNDEKQADAAAKHALLASAQANLDRLRELKGFKRVVAPFAGVVTARQTDIGALINSGAGNGAALFRVADIDRLRIYCQVPESLAPLIRPGIKVRLGVAVMPGKNFEAEVVRTADALDTNSRSLLVEIAADNSDHAILPGGFAEVHFHLPVAAGRPLIPVSALIFRSNGLQVAKIDAQQRVHLVSIKLGRDLGTQVEVASGLAVGEKVVISPPDSLSDGDQVRVSGAAATDREVR
jgi:RND family efflux transporter MFP subunit